MDKEEIEEMITELTKVRPEMLNKEALKLFNCIMLIIDTKEKLETKVEQLEADNYADNNMINEYIEIDRERREKIKQLENKLKEYEEREQKVKDNLNKIIDEENKLWNSVKQADFNRERCETAEEILNLLEGENNDN